MHYPLYGPLFAAGGVGWERWLGAPRPMIMRVLLLSFVASGIMLAPLTLPILPVESYLRYAGTLVVKPATSENLELAELPQFFADRFGWKEKAHAVAEVYRELSPEEQKNCRVFADNYGRCGAIDFFGRAYGLPPAIGGHTSYWIWGPGDFDGHLVIILGGELGDHQDDLEEVVVAATVSCRSCMPYEDNLNIYVCRRLKDPIQEVWPSVKHYM